MPERALGVSREAFPEPAWLDTAVSRALLERASEAMAERADGMPVTGDAPHTLRVYRPARVLAFGPSDSVAPGYHEARAIAAAAGFAPVERLAGGHAAVFHEQTVTFGWTVPHRSPRTTIHERFRVISALIAEALVTLGVDARVGAVPGEYCPGDYSVNARGRVKLMGVGQRVLPRAAHVGGVIVVDGADAVRDVLAPVNDALGIAWDPATAGSVRDEVPGVTWDDVAGALIAAFAARFDLYDVAIDGDTLAHAREMDGPFAPPDATAGAVTASPA
jgi:lipoate-protein ligase A